MTCLLICYVVIIYFFSRLAVLFSLESFTGSIRSGARHTRKAHLPRASFTQLARINI